MPEYASPYLALATASGDGMPWVTPVWFAPDGDGLLWVSKPGRRHSRNVGSVLIAS